MGHTHRAARRAPATMISTTAAALLADRAARLAHDDDARRATLALTLAAKRAAFADMLADDDLAPAPTTVRRTAAGRSLVGRLSRFSGLALALVAGLASGCTVGAPPVAVTTYVETEDGTWVPMTFYAARGVPFEDVAFAHSLCTEYGHLSVARPVCGALALEANAETVLAVFSVLD